MLSQAVILVGGQGTRLQPLTNLLPKPMIPVLNRPFVEHTIAYLKSHQVREVILTVSHLPEVVQGYLGDGRNLGMRLIYGMENVPLGTAGAVKNVEPYLEGTFAVFNGDIFTTLDLTDMLAFHRKKRAKVTIALTWVDNPCAFGVVETDNNGRVRRFVEKPGPDQVTTHWINAGIYILEPEVLKHMPGNSHYMFERGLFPLLLELGEPVYGYPFRGYWLDMGTPEKYLCLNCDLLSAKVVSHLLDEVGRGGVSSGRDVFVHPSAELKGSVVIGSRCHIDQRAQIRGPVVIGDDCHIGEGARLERVILWKGVSVAAGVNLKHCVVSRNAFDNGEQVVDCGNP